MDHSCCIWGRAAKAHIEYIPRGKDKYTGNNFFICHWIFTYSYNMKVTTKESSIAEKISRLLWDSNPVCPDKNPLP